MKIAQCKYTQAGVDITLNVYFDQKAFEFITPAMSRKEEEEFIHLACDSIAAALPREKAEKHFYIKRIFKLASMNSLKILCTDGFLIDSTLTIPFSQQAYSKERVKLIEIDQLPADFKISNDLLKSMNERLPLFEEEAIKTGAHGEVAALKKTTRQNQPQAVIREFKTEKVFDVLSAITQIKKEIRDLAESNIKTLKEKITQETKNPAQGIDTEKYKEALAQKINEIAPIDEKFSAETDEISQRITQQTDKLFLFKQHVINALYASAKQFYGIVLPKMQDTPLHVKKSLQADFNKKFAGIASLSESGELSNLEEAQKNLETLSLESLQEIISNEHKETPGLLQKCNTSWTEESPELQIVMKQLSQLNKTLTALFKDDAKYANQEMVVITRTPFPRSFQFKFSETAINYKNVVDDFCKTQKEILMNLANQYKKILQLNDLPLKQQAAPAQTEVLKKPGEDSDDLRKRKEISDTILSLASKDHDITEKYRNTAKQLHDFVSANINSSLKLLIEKINASVEKIQTDAASADALMQQLIDTKSQIDIKINHYILHPAETPDINELDQKILSMGEQRNLLLSKNKVLQNSNNKLAAYDNIIRRVREIDLLTTKTTVHEQRNEAKEFLLQFIQKENNNPASAEALKKRMIEQYTRVDTNASDIDKIMDELANLQNAIFTDLETQPELSTEKLEMRFQTIAEKMQALSLTVGVMNENVSGLRKLNLEANTMKK